MCPTSEADGGKGSLERHSGGDPAKGKETKLQDQEARVLIIKGPEWQENTPALLSLQQFAVGGDLNIEGHLHIEQVLVLSQVTGHVVLHMNKVQLRGFFHVFFYYY